MNTAKIETDHVLGFTVYNVTFLEQDYELAYISDLTLDQALAAKAFWQENNEMARILLKAHYL